MERNQGLDIRVIRKATTRRGEVEQIVANMLPLGTVYGSGYNEAGSAYMISDIQVAEELAIEDAISKARQLRAELLILREPKHEVWPDVQGVAIIADVEGSAFGKFQEDFLQPNGLGFNINSFADHLREDRSRL